MANIIDNGKNNNSRNIVTVIVNGKINFLPFTIAVTIILPLIYFTGTIGQNIQTGLL